MLYLCVQSNIVTFRLLRFEVKFDCVKSSMPSSESSSCSTDTSSCRTSAWFANNRAQRWQVSEVPTIKVAISSDDRVDSMLVLVWHVARDNGRLAVLNVKEMIIYLVSLLLSIKTARKKERITHFDERRIVLPYRECESRVAYIIVIPLCASRT